MTVQYLNQSDNPHSWRYVPTRLLARRRAVRSFTIVCSARRKSVRNLPAVPRERTKERPGVNRQFVRCEENQGHPMQVCWGTVRNVSPSFPRLVHSIRTVDLNGNSEWFCVASALAAKLSPPSQQFMAARPLPVL